MLKFLAKIQFSMEMTLWLIVYVALLGVFKALLEFALCGMGAKLPALTIFYLEPEAWIHWWMIPIVIITLAIIELKFTLSKWLQWTVRLCIFLLICVTIFAPELASHPLCRQIK